MWTAQVCHLSDKIKIGSLDLPFYSSLYPLGATVSDIRLWQRPMGVKDELCCSGFSLSGSGSMVCAQTHSTQLRLWPMFMEDAQPQDSVMSPEKWRNVT